MVILRQIAEKVESKSKNMRTVFRAFDEDKSGTVDLVEFRRGLAHLGCATTAFSPYTEYYSLTMQVRAVRSACVVPYMKV